MGITPIIVDRQWGPGQSPGRKEFHVIILGFTNHLWFIDNLIFYNCVIQHSWLIDLTSSGEGEDFPPWPHLETVCLHPPSVEGPALRCLCAFDQTYRLFVL